MLLFLIYHNGEFRIKDMSNTPLYSVIYNKIKQQIISGELSPGTRLSTEMEIASENSVSRITATRALKELEQNGLIRRRKGSGSYVNEPDQWHSGGSKTGKENTLSIISLIIPFDEVFSSDFLAGIEEAADKKGCFVTFHNSRDTPETEKEIIENLIEKGSRGIIVYPTMTPGNMDLFSRLMIRRFPLVLIDRMIPGLEIPLVGTDNNQAFYNITSHLIELGHKRIIFAGSMVYSISSELDRYSGFCKAHLDHNLPLMNKHLYTSQDKLPGDYKPETPLYERACHYLFDTLEAMDPAERPTAIAAVNDVMAEYIIRTAADRGIRIPEDYSVTG